MDQKEYCYYEEEGTPTYENDSDPLPFIQWDRNSDRFGLTREGEEFLKSLNGPLAVVSVAGPMRQGKSYIMNRLNNQQKGFPLGSSINSCTQGAWIWLCKKEIDSEEGPCKIILMDFEGLFDPMRDNKPKRYDMGLMTFACLLSSLLVYNIKGNIDSSAIETLQLMTKVVEQLKKKKKNRKNFANYFPSFLWVLRDFFLRMEDEKGRSMSPKEYLDINLDVAARVKQTDSEKDDSDDSDGDEFDQAQIPTEEQKGLFALKSYFRERDLFTLCRPVNDEEQLRNLENVPFSELKPQFREESEELVDKVFSMTKPKKIYDTKGISKIANGSALVEYAKVIINSYNNNKSLAFDDAWKSVAALSCQKAKVEAFDHFESKMSSLFKAVLTDGVALENDELDNVFEESRTEALEIFIDKAVAGPPSEEVQDELISDMKERFSALETQNMILSEEKCRQWAKEQEDIMSERLRQGKYTTQEDFFMSLEDKFKSLKDVRDLGPWRMISSDLVADTINRLTESASLHFKISEQEQEAIRQQQEFAIQQKKTEEKLQQLQEDKERMEKEALQRIEDQKRLEEEFNRKLDESKREATERVNQLRTEMQNENNKAVERMMEIQQSNFGKMIDRMDATANQRSKDFQATLDSVNRSNERELALTREIANAQAAAARAQAEAQAARNSGRRRGKCFSASSLVTIQSRDECFTSQIVISELCPGDKVLSVNKNGEIFFDEVFYCSHMHDFTGANEVHKLLKFTLSNGQTLGISENHLCYGEIRSAEPVKDDCIELFGENVYPREADSFKIGDKLFYYDERTTSIQKAVVIDKTKCIDKIRAPLTETGNLIVNGVLASSYVSNHSFGHASTLPLRAVHKMYSGSANSIFWEKVWQNLIGFRRQMRNISMTTDAVSGKTVAFGVFGGIVLGAAGVLGGIALGM